VKGEYEPKDSDIEEDKILQDEPSKVEVIEEDVQKEKGKNKKEENVVGIPDFWFQALMRHPDFGNMIQEEDDDALKYLTDITTSLVDGGPSFSIEFHFKSNPYFNETLLKKVYTITSQESTGEIYDHMESTEITWKPGKNLTKRTIAIKSNNKKGRGGARGAIQAVKTKETTVQSFFLFFQLHRQL